MLYERSVEHIFTQLWLKSISCAYFHWVVTKIDQLLYDRSVVRIFIQLWLKSISCYTIDHLFVFLYSRGRLFNGLRYCHENFLQYFHPFTRCVMVLKKSASCVIDTPPFATMINRIPLFPPRMKIGKKPDTDTSGIFDEYSWGSKSALLLSRILFLEPKNKKLTSQFCIYTWS